MATIQQLRQLYGAESDEQAILAAAKEFGISPTEIANEVGYDVGGKNASRLGASIDSYQAGLYGLGEAVTGADFFRRGREANDASAGLQREFAREQGAISSYKDVNSVGTGVDYLTGLTIDSLPYIGEAVVGGVAGRAALTGARGLGLSRNVASGVGAAAASYPSSVGSILQAQREQADGQTDLLSAAALGVPFAAANVLGVEGMAARATLARNGVKALDDMTGVTGGLARAGATGLRTGISESISETGQEGLTQVGRMQVDPNETFINDESLDRFAESAVGGFALGKVTGAGLGGWRRSEPVDLLNPGQNPNIGVPADDFVDIGSNPGVPGPSTPAGSITGTDTTALLGDPMGSGLAGLGVTAPLTSAPSSLTGSDVGSLLGSPMGDNPLLGATPPEMGNTTPPAGPGAPTPPTPNQSRAESIKAMVEERRKEISALNARATEFGIKGDKAVQVYGDLEKAFNDGVIDDAQFAENVAMLAERKIGQVGRFIEGIRQIKTDIANSNEQAKADALASVKNREAKKGSTGGSQSVVSAAPGGAAAGPATTAAQAQPATTPTVESAVPAAGAQPAGGGAVGSPASVEGQQGAVATGLPELITVGRKGREKQVTKEGLRTMLAKAPQLDRDRIYSAMGLAETTDPDTGKKILVPIANPRTLDRVAALESLKTGKKVTRQAIQQTLTKYGIDMDAINAATGESPDTRTEAELGIGPDVETSGFRVEDRLSDATSQGLVDDGTAPNEAQKALIAQADKVLESNNTVEPDAYDPAADETRAEREARARAKVEQDLIEALETPWGESARSDWNDAETGIEFDKLPSATQLEFIDEHKRQVEETGNEWDPIQRLVDRIAEEARASDSPVAGVRRMVEARSGLPSSVEGGVSRDVQDAGQVAWDSMRAQFPQMPPYAGLSERQKKQVRDLVQREVFNLAAANTIATEINKDVLGTNVPINGDVLQSRSSDKSPRVSFRNGRGVMINTDYNVSLREIEVDDDIALEDESRVGAVMLENIDRVAGSKGGSASATLKALTDWADQNGKRLVLMPSGNIAGSREALKSWYARNGFVEAADGAMERAPQPTSQNGRAKPVSVEFEDIESMVSGADLVRGQLADLGIESALDHVRDWELVDDPRDPTEGEISHNQGAYAVTLNVGAGLSPAKVARTLRHEIAHAMDMAPHGGIYSVHPDMRVRVINGRVLPVGKVSAEIVSLYRSNWAGVFRQFLSYPLDISRFGAEMAQSSLISQTDRIQMEMYAQMMAFYTSGPEARAELAKRAPETAKFLARTIESFKNAPNPQIKKHQAASARRDAFASANPDGGGGRVGQDRGDAGQAARGERLKSLSTANAPRQVSAAAEAVGSFMQAMKDGTSWLGIRTMFTEDLIALAAKVIPAARQYKAAMDKVEVERGRMERDIVQILQDFRNLPKHEQGTGPSSVNALLRESTMSKKWAYKPSWLTSVEIDPVLQAQFERLSPAGQLLVRRVFRHGYDTLQQMQQAVMENVRSEFDGDIKAAVDSGDTVKADKLRAQKSRQISDFQSLLDLRGGWPYAPLKRFGKHVVMGMSKAYMDAKQAGDTARMQTLQKDGDHYYVAFAETKVEARRMVAELQGSFPDGEVGTFEKLDDAEQMFGGRDMLGAFQRLRRLTKETSAGEDGRVSDRVDNLMRQLYLTLLSETSARKGELHRRGIAGADKDMMRAFATQGRATAHFIAGLRTNGKITDHLQDMRSQVRESLLGDRDQKQAYFNEIMRRHSMNLEFTPSGLIDKAMAGTSVWMLLSNPSYYLINATQPWMMSVPFMAGRHGYARAQGELVRAMRDLAPILKDGSFTEEDYSKLPADVRSAIEELANRGVIDISLESVLGNFESAADSPLRHVDTVVQKLRGVAQTVESMNRLATAMAAYRMERGRGSSTAAAVDYAGQVIYETHGDYSGFNAPRFMRQGIGKLATQFRKFQLIQISMFARLLNRAFKSTSKEERLVAKKILAFQLAHLFAAGGLMGLPGFAAIAWITGKVLSDDDEPDDPEATLRRLIGDKELADLLLKGAPKLAGIDISGRVGAGGMLSVLPYTDIEMSREGYANVVTGLMGPLVGGLLPRAVDGMSQIASGDVWKGMESLLPTGLANAIKGARLSTEGLTKRNGDVVLSAEEIGMLDGLAQAVGLPSNTLTDQRFLANAQFKADTFYRERTTQLKRDYTEAVRSNDADRIREVRQEWMNTQAARKALGYKVQPLSELLRAPQEQTKRERSVVSGVVTSPTNRGFVAPLTGE